ncbi:MAG: glycosyl transferase [Hyphomicrobiales bacterium]|nr:glycosyl transferase [Hyphomicrobiales bacterium]
MSRLRSMIPGKEGPDDERPGHVGHSPESFAEYGQRPSGMQAVGCPVSPPPRDRALHRISVIIPVLDEAEGIADVLGTLGPWRALGHEVIVADGGSRDATCEIARPRCDGVVQAPRGRASQMNAAARQAHGEILLFLHADTQLPDNAGDAIQKALSRDNCVWGRFDVRIVGRSRFLPVVSRMMNWRSRLSGIATGDQAMFMHRSVFEEIGGFPDQPIMEDLAMSARLLKFSAPACLKGPAVTSGRRWDRHGALRTILLMWRLRAAYFFGADPRTLARRYGYVPRDT